MNLRSAGVLARVAPKEVKRAKGQQDGEDNSSDDDRRYTVPWGATRCLTCHGHDGHDSGSWFMGRSSSPSNGIEKTIQNEVAVLR